jgi:carbonic anhydrase
MWSVSRIARATLLAVALSLAAFGVALAQEGVHWSYEGESGPEHWGQLSSGFAACAKGVEQSPVDIPAGAPVNPADIAFSYQPSAVNIFNNGHTVQVAYAKGGSITLDGVIYSLDQFHFHAASEHAIGGAHSPLEIHLVHKNAQGGLAVVGVLLKAGAENPAYAPVLRNLPAQVSRQPAPVAGAIVDANQLLPAQRGYWRYNGSLTTPPCSEGVKWLVMSTPVELSEAQIAAFTSLYKDDARPLQPFNSRAFLVSARLPVAGGATVRLDGALAGAGLLALGAGLALASMGRRRAS